jgi:signal transduction histidine kinase
MPSRALNLGRAADTATGMPASSSSHDRGLLTTERRVLEMVVRGRPLADALGELTRSIEARAPGMLASVLELDGEHLRHGAAPSLPAAYRNAIDGARIGPNVGSCGTAAHERRVVIAADIASDPRWTTVKALALQHGLHACWSTPIFATDGRVLGTFALYYREPRTPVAEELELIDGAAHVASVVMERCQSDRQREVLIEDLSRAVRFSEMFTGVLGHDLRNPLGAISIGARRLQGNPGGDNAAGTAGRILSSAMRMNRMIEQLLDFTRIRMGRGLAVERESVDLLEVCAYVADEVGGLAGRRDVIVEHQGDTTGRWDRDRLLQLFSNVVGNAAQHGAPGAPVSVTLDGTRPDSITVAVTNAGEIPAASMDALFDPFRREGTGAPGARRGLGLGLFISQHIVQVHDGTIQVASARGATTFTLTLPRGEPASAAPAVVTFQAGDRR